MLCNIKKRKSMKSKVNSMTAFARQELSLDQAELAWEIRSVNHRYLDVNMRLPETYRGLEMALRDKLRKALQRGKVDCSLQVNLVKTQQNDIEINHQQVQAYQQAINEIDKRKISQ